MPEREDRDPARMDGETQEPDGAEIEVPEEENDEEDDDDIDISVIPGLGHWYFMTRRWTIDWAEGRVAEPPPEPSFRDWVKQFAEDSAELEQLKRKKEERRKRRRLAREGPATVDWEAVRRGVEQARKDAE